MPRTKIQNRFVSLIELCEKEIRDENYGSTLKTLIGELRRLAADSHAVNVLMEDSEWLAIRFDNLVEAWKMVRDEQQAAADDGLAGQLLDPNRIKSEVE